MRLEFGTHSSTESIDFELGQNCSSFCDITAKIILLCRYQVWNNRWYHDGETTLKLLIQLLQPFLITVIYAIGSASTPWQYAVSFQAVTFGDMKVDKDLCMKLNDAQSSFLCSQVNWSAQQPVEMWPRCGPVSTMVQGVHLSISLTFTR